MSGVSEHPSETMHVIQNFIAQGNPGIKYTIADQYVPFALSTEAGLPVDVLALVDGRKSNSCRCAGFDFTKYEAFWRGCEEVLLLDAVTEEMSFALPGTLLIKPCFKLVFRDILIPM